MKEYKKYIETNEFPGNTHLQISVYYSKGGTSYFSGQNNPRGFYVSVTPVKRDGITVSYLMFSGYSHFLFGANRYSEKQHDKAIEMSGPEADKIIERLKAEQKEKTA